MEITGVLGGPVLWRFYQDRDAENRVSAKFGFAKSVFLILLALVIAIH